jgi:hypothetical protein
MTFLIILLAVVIGFFIGGAFVRIATPRPTMPSFSLILRDQYSRQLFGINSSEVLPLIARHSTLEEKRGIDFTLLIDTSPIKLELTDTTPEIGP